MFPPKTVINEFAHWSSSLAPRRPVQRVCRARGAWRCGYGARQDRGSGRTATLETSSLTARGILDASPAVPVIRGAVSLSQVEALLVAFYSLPWCTYRRDFVPLPGVSSPPSLL